MNVVVVYGCPCSGKSSYVEGHMRQNDIAYDYDRLLTAVTYQKERGVDKHNAHEILLRIRQVFIDKVKDMPQAGTAYIMTRWPSDYLKKALEGLEVKYKLIEATQAECLKNLQNDASRTNKADWIEIINEWFKQHSGETREAVYMKELRYCEIRADAPAGAESRLIIEGMPIVYEQATQINDPVGAYKEVIKRGALDSADLSDVRLLYNHDLNKVPLARTPKTMQLLSDPAGLKMVACLPDTAEARSVYAAVERGDLSGMSFAFKVPVGGDSYDHTIKTRTIAKIEKVYECSIVPFPAYPQTSVEARAAITKAENDPVRAAAKIKINQIRKVRFNT